MNAPTTSKSRFDVLSRSDIQAARINKLTRFVLRHPGTKDVVIKPQRHAERPGKGVRFIFIPQTMDLYLEMA